MARNFERHQSGKTTHKKLTHIVFSFCDYYLFLTKYPDEDYNQIFQKPTLRKYVFF